jgi:transposase
MAFREVTMHEVKEVLRQHLRGVAKKRIASRVGVDPKTVRRYVQVAETHGVTARAGEESLTDERLALIVAELMQMPGRPRGDAWERCETQRAFIAEQLDARVKLTKVRKLLLRRGVKVPYATLHRFATHELGFGKKAPTVPVADGEPGEELQLDTGWLATVVPDERGRRRRLRVWIFTPSLSRYRFVYPCIGETTASAIEACEAAWRFYDGVFRVLIVDNTKAIVAKADSLGAVLVDAFLEYAQARGFIVDAARARKPKDKARVERSVRYVRDDCFGGESIRDVDHAREHAARWCRHEAGAKRHSRTLRAPKEHFDSEECAALLPAPAEAYDLPHWCDPKVARDHYAQVLSALYTLPTKWIGHTLRARADKYTVRFYNRGTLVKTHPRKPRGGKSTDPNDFPEHQGAVAQRDTDFLIGLATKKGPHVEDFAETLLAGPMPWTRMRQVYALLGLAKKYGADRLDEACRVSLELEMYDVRRLARMLERRVNPEQLALPLERAPAPARFLRPASDYALARSEAAAALQRHDEETDHDDN